MKNINLAYADETNVNRVLDDLTILSRDGVGPKSLGPTVGVNPADTSLAGLKVGLEQRGIAVEDFSPGDDLPATSAVVDDDDTAPVQNSAGAAIGTGTINVAANAVTNIRLPATVAGVSNGQALTVGGSTYTFTVANGVITAIAVS